MNVHSSAPIAMPISSLVITLAADDAAACAALAELRSDARIDVGAREGRRVPVVVDTGSAEEDRAVWQHVQELHGVDFVDLVFVHYGDSTPNEQNRPAGTPIGRFHRADQDRGGRPSSSDGRR